MRHHAGGLVGTSRLARLSCRLRLRLGDPRMTRLPIELFERLTSVRGDKAVADAAGQSGRPALAEQSMEDPPSHLEAANPALKMSLGVFQVSSQNIRRYRNRFISVFLKNMCVTSFQKNTWSSNQLF